MVLVTMIFSPTVKNAIPNVTRTDKGIFRINLGTNKNNTAGSLEKLSAERERYWIPMAFESQHLLIKYNMANG